MQPEAPNNTTPPDPQGQPPEAPATNPAAGQVIAPSSVQQPAQGGSEQPAATQPPVEPPKDNHKILNEFGSPAFPTPAPQIPEQPKKSHKKLLLIIAAALVVLLGGGAAAYFGYVVPNKPENIWKNALVNTGKAYDELETYTEDVAQIKNWSQEGKFDVTGAVVADGKFEGKSKGDTGQLTGNFSSAGMKIDFDLRTLPSADEGSPDLYIKADGLQGIGTFFGQGDPQLAAALEGLNDQWYVIDHTLFEQMGASLDEGSFNNEEVAALVKALGKTTKEYVFTDDSKKSVITMKEVVGKEKREGRDTYHYKAGIDKANAKEYLKALCGDVNKSELVKSLGQNSTDCNESAKSADDIKASDTADVWVDTTTKLVQAIRFTDTKDKGTYLEVSQNFTGGHVVPLKFHYNMDKDGGQAEFIANVSINRRTHEMSVDAKFKTKGAADDQEDSTQLRGATLNITLKPNAGEVKVEKPEGAKTIIELLNDFGVGSLLEDGLSEQPDSDPALQTEEPTSPNVRLLFENRLLGRNS